MLREILGQGGSGTVYSALDQTVGQKIALKVLHPELRDERNRERLRREVRATRPGHPNLVTVFDLHEIDGHVLLSMELVEGRSLHNLLEENRTLEWPRVVILAGQITSALAHLHQRGLVHRDIKPRNIMVDGQGNAKLCDMGLARPVDQGTTVTETEALLGTPSYMAPEQGVGLRPTPASDIYGLGITLFQCLSGFVPLKADTAVSTLTRRQRERSPDIRRTCPECPKWLDRLVRRMLEPDPRDRPSAPAIGSALEKERAWPRLRRKSVRAAALALVAAVILGAIGMLFARRPTERIEIRSQTVTGLDQRGRPTWEFDLPGPVATTVSVDLDVDGDPETIVSGSPEVDHSNRNPELRQSYVVAFRKNGEIVTEMIPETLVPDSWQYQYAVEFRPEMVAIDIDRDGWIEIVVTAKHRRFFPTALMVFWPRWDLWDVVALHPGHIYLVTNRAPENGVGLRMLAVNNQIGMLPFFGELELVPPDQRNPRDAAIYNPATTPPEGLGIATTGRFLSYIPLEMNLGGPPTAKRIDDLPHGGVRLNHINRITELDRWFNDQNGPNAGLDLRDRRYRFLNQLRFLNPGFGAVSPDGVHEIIVSLRETGGPLLQEPGYEIMLSILGARALAAVGEVEAAIAMLEAVNDGIFVEDVLYRLAHLHATSGDLESANDYLTTLIDRGQGPRSGFDGIVLFLLTAIHQRSEEGVATAIAFLAKREPGRESETELRASLRARANLWWDEVRPSDGVVGSPDLDAEGMAVASLARWRLGTSTDSDIVLMQAFIEDNPDGATLGRIALSAAMVENGRGDDAVLELERLVAELETTATYDFHDLECLRLARALHATAILQSGRVEAARSEAMALAPDLDGNLLPGILVHEVIEQTSGANQLAMH